MGYYSRNKLNRILSVGALSFPVAILICLAIVFAGCTSPFSPFNLYFMKVDLSDFPHLGVSAARRSHVPEIGQTKGVGLIGHLVRSTIDDAEQTMAKGATTVFSQVSSHLQAFLQEIKADLPEYYHVGLLGYCKGRDNIINSCSDPSTSFSFNLWGLFQSLAPNASGLSAGDGETYLTGNLNSTRAIICLYISAFIAAFLSLVLGIKKTVAPGGNSTLVACSVVTTILLTVATAWVISLYDFYAQHIEETLGQYGARASLGANTIASTCLAVAFSSASIFVNIWFDQL